MSSLAVFSVIYKSIRSRMCAISASLQYTDYTSAESTYVINRLSDALRQWGAVYRFIENNLCAGFGNKQFLLSQVREGNIIIRQLCSEMQNDIQRWVAADELKQKMQLGAIICYRFHSFLSHGLNYMNRCETIIATEIQPHCTIKEKHTINLRLISSFTAEEWIEQTFQLLPDISEKDRRLRLQYLQTYLPDSAWYPFANAEDMFMTTAQTKINHIGKRNGCCNCQAAQKSQYCNKAYKTIKTEE